jgi:hypothetical protein
MWSSLLDVGDQILSRSKKTVSISHTSGENYSKYMSATQYVCVPTVLCVVSSFSKKETQTEREIEFGRRL